MSATPQHSAVGRLEPADKPDVAEVCPEPAPCLDYEKICKRAIAPLRKKGSPFWAEREEMISIGYVAIAKKLAKTGGVLSEALAIKVARDAMRDAYRKEELRREDREYVQPLEGESDTDALDRRDSRQKRAPEGAGIDVWAAARTLPDQQFQVIQKYFYGKATQAEIAEEMGISQQAVGKILKKAKNSLRDVLKPPATESTKG